MLVLVNWPYSVLYLKICFTITKNNTFDSKTHKLPPKVPVYSYHCINL